MFDRSSWTLLHIRGIPIRLHISLLILLPYIAFVEAVQFAHVSGALGIPQSQLGLSSLGWGLLLAVAIFVCIALHEMAHALIALRSGVPVKAITLMALGGVSQLEHDVPPEREAVMAGAGPLTSIALALLFFALSRLSAFSPPLAVGLLLLAEINLILGIFNMLPAFPMDGGRVLRGLLAGKIGLDRATRTAATLGRVMAVAFGIWGILSFNFILVLIAVFVYAGAAEEGMRLRARGILRGVPVGRLMTDRLGETKAGELASDVARRLFANHQIAARVTNGTTAEHPTAGIHELGDHTIGIVTVWDLARVEGPGAVTTTAGALMHSDLPQMHTGDDSAPALEAVATGRASSVMVLDADEHVVGLVTPIELQWALALSSAASLEDPKAGA